MDVWVAMVEVDRRYFQDRLIAGLRGGQEYSHAALIIRPGGESSHWVDVHWRWFRSDLRVIPPENYTWSHSIHPIREMTSAKARLISDWVLQQQGSWVTYDLLGALRILLNYPSEDSPRSFTCFEFVTRALLEAGYVLEYDPEKALGSDLVESGILLDPVREVIVGE